MKVLPHFEWLKLENCPLLDAQWDAVRCATHRWWNIDFSDWLLQTNLLCQPEMWLRNTSACFLCAFCFPFFSLKGNHPSELPALVSGQCARSMSGGGGLRGGSPRGTRLGNTCQFLDNIWGTVSEARSPGLRAAGGGHFHSRVGFYMKTHARTAALVLSSGSVPGHF